MPEASLENPIEKYFKKFTRYHRYFLCIYFTTKMTSVWHTLNMIFLSPPMEYTCDSSTEKNNGSNVCPCANPVWDHSIFKKTVQTKFDIICGKTWMISFSESISFFGLLVGAFAVGVLSDRYGRLLMYAICQVIIGSAGSFVTLMPTMPLFCTMRFLEGIGTGGAIVAGFVFCVEFCGPDFRPIVSSLIHLSSNIGLIFLAGIAYLLRDCDHFQLAVSIPVLFCVFIKCLLLESPKWLLDKYNKEEAIKAMEKFCRFNKISSDTIRSELEAYITSRKDSNIQQMKFYHIFKYKTHAKNFCCMAYLYFVCGMCYYGVSQFIGKMSPRVHVNTVFNGILLITGTVITIFIINKLGRRPFLRGTMLLAGLFMLIVVCLPVTFKPFYIRTLFACFASSCYYVSFNIIFLYCVELFPTNIRSCALGVLSLISRIGQVIGPQINTLSSTAAATTFAILALIGSFVTFFLPETKGIELPSTLESSQHVRFSDRVSTVPATEATTVKT